MSEINSTRITFKRSRPNPLFESWLEELHEESCSKKSKLEPMLKEALTSLSKYPLPLLTGAECAILSGFDKRLCQFIDNRLEVYKNNKQLHTKVNPNPKPSSSTEPSSSESSRNNHIHAPQALKVSTSTDSNGVVKKVNKKKQYKPVHRSGGYAILLGLLECRKSNNIPINKDNLIDIAQKYSEESFIRPKPDSFYTAWSNMSKLITKGLVKKEGGKKISYSLTEQGILLANELLEETKNVPSINNKIFNDNVLETSSRSPERMEPVLEKESNYDLCNRVEAANQNNERVYEMSVSSFDVILLIDKNETSGLSKKNDPTMAQFQKYPDLKHEYRSLKVGDFTWIARHKVDKTEFLLPYIVERKRMDDLGASVKDGRFHEQKFRLRRCGVGNVIYMVEKYGSNKHVGLPVQSLMQALANTRIQDGFKVHMTDSLTHSVRFLAIMTKRLTIKYKDKSLKGRNQEPVDDVLMTFDYFNKSSVKNRPLSVTDTFIKLLLQLKGVSVEKALAITREYKTPRSLFKAYESCGKREGEQLLANLKLTNASRNVGPCVSKSIYQLFTFVNM